MSKRGFTLIELAIAMTVIAVGLVAVIRGISRSITFLDKTKNEVIAINLAREGMEAVYQIRNTNRLRGSGMKDYYRLGVNPFVPEDGWAQGNVNYSLRHDGYWFMVPIGQPFEVSSDVYNEAFRLCLQDGKYTTNPACPEDQKSPYYRVVIGKGLYDKQTGTAITCVDGSSTYSNGGVSQDCSDTIPKEFHFCVRVTSSLGIGNDIELCGLVTNFEE